MKTLVVLALCAACSFGGKRPNYHYYVLTSKHDARAAPSQRVGEPRAHRDNDVTIPGYLDRDQIATRTVGHQLEYSRTDRWAEPLDQALQRTLRESLAAQLGSSGIAVQSHGGVPTYDLDVDVLRFERTGAAHVELWARWTLRSNTALLDRGEARLRVPMRGGDSNAMASALSDAVDEMATDIARRVHDADVVATRGR
jgi:uncharacterized lipoprotein YmbA